MRCFLDAARHITSNDVSWPTRVDRLKQVPRELWIAGALAPKPAIAIVGSRRASAEGMEFTKKLSCDLAAAGWIIASGGARGIDTAAHQGAIAAGGQTWVVLPTGIGAPYPARNHNLFKEVIACGGALISEQPPDASAQRWMFAERNRIIAALSQAVVVVQAPEGSGALITAKWAKKLGITCFYVPSAPWDPRGQGTLALAKVGASICTSAQDVLSHPALTGAEVATSSTWQRPTAAPRSRAMRRSKASQTMNQALNTHKINDLTPDQELVLAELRRGAQRSDDVVLATGLSAKRVQSALVMLSLAAHVRELPGGVFKAHEDC